MTTLVLSDLRRDEALAGLLSETLHDKPTIDETGKWVTRLTALRRDERGFHDRPLLTAIDLTTAHANKESGK